MKEPEMSTLELLMAMREKLPPQPKFPEVEVLRLQPGDILTLNTPNWLPQTQFKLVADQLKEMIPEGVHIAILDGGARFTVVRPTENQEETHAISDGQTA